jgi:hypothetical protein
MHLATGKHMLMTEVRVMIKCFTLHYTKETGTHLSFIEIPFFSILCVF